MPSGWFIRNVSTDRRSGQASFKKLKKARQSRHRNDRSRSPEIPTCSSDDLRARCSAIDLVQAADKVRYSAKNAGRAHARLLDIADVDTPHLARDIAPSSRKPRATG